MSVPAWPYITGRLALTHPNAGNAYGVQPDNGVLETSMDIGPGKARRICTADYDMVNFNVTATVAEFNTLKAFWRDDCKKVLPFTKGDALSGASASYRWNGPPVITGSHGGDVYSVAIKLKRLP